MLHKIIKGLAPVAAVAIAVGLSGCDARMSINDSEGVPLSELDMSGDAPTELVLAGPDHVKLTGGDKLAIDVSGDADAVEALRFTLDDGTLGIMRDFSARDIDGYATVNVTMPHPKAIVIAGSGQVEAESLASEAELVIAGSGSASATKIDAKSLEVSVAGSGSLEAAGNAEKLELNIGGSGRADMGALKVDKAEISIAGSGAASFASDGEVEANIVGSGDVRVTGSAKCTVNAVGSGTLTCQAAPTAEAAANTASSKKAAAKAKTASKKTKKRVAKRKPGSSGPAKA